MAIRVLAHTSQSAQALLNYMPVLSQTLGGPSYLDAA